MMTQHARHRPYQLIASSISRLSFGHSHQSGLIVLSRPRRNRSSAISCAISSTCPMPSHLTENHPLMRHALAGRITRFIHENLHRGLTLKVLANFLGYSEKYCSDLFGRIMGESFFRVHETTSGRTCSSHSSPRLRRRWQKLLQQSDSAINSAFSHFFKRATGHSPSESSISTGYTNGIG
jgi:AraC-like DNA-binding protein